MRPLTDPVKRFVQRIELTDSCWLWTGQIYQNGYGNFAVKRGDKWKAEYVHRFAYERFVEPIPAGLDIDHLCRNRACVNPDHLEPVTRRENLRRGISHNREKTHCVNGHEYTPDNTFVEHRSDGGLGRKCRICMRASRARARAKANAE